MESPRVLVAGEALIDFVPAEAGTLDQVESFTRRAGGAPANVAVGLASLEVPSTLWTRLGDDPFGDVLADRLDDAGVDDTLVHRDSGAATGLAFLARTGDDRSFTFVRNGSADTRLQQGAVSDEYLRDTEWVHLGGFALSVEPARSAILDLAERAVDHGCTVSVDPNVRPEAWTNTAELRTVTGWLLDTADVVFATPEELETLGFDGTDNDALAAAVAGRGPDTVVLTLGADGATAYTTAESPYDGPATHEGFSVSVVDNTGAGDAFVAGAIGTLVNGSPLSDAIAVGNAMGALTTTAVGAIEAMPTSTRVETLLDDDS